MCTILQKARNTRTHTSSLTLRYTCSSNRVASLYHIAGNIKFGESTLSRWQTLNLEFLMPQVYMLQCKLASFLILLSLPNSPILKSVPLYSNLIILLNFLPSTHGQDYHSLLFGSGRNVASLANNVTSSLCLPISIQEVLDMNQATQVDTTQAEVWHTLPLKAVYVGVGLAS